MPNRVRNKTVTIRDQILADLDRIYGSEWRKIESEFNELVESIYLGQEETTQRERLKYAEKNGKKNDLIELIVAAAILANIKAIQRINSGMDKIYTINATDVISYAFERTGIKLETRGVNVNSLLGKHTRRRYDKATDSKYVSREVLREINKMLKAGDGTKKISKRLQKVYGFNKTSAMSTTRTETTRIQSRGRFDVMQEASKKGFVFEKIWQHSHASKVPRDWHLTMHGEKQNLDKPFSNGLMMPGESGAPAEEVISCACYLDEELISW